MQFEDVLSRVGGFGLYQKLLVFILIPLSTGLVGLIYYIQLIVLDTSPFRCKVPMNATNENGTITGNFTEFSKDPEQCKLACSEWEFDEDYLFSTIASESQWVCDEAWRPYIIVTCFWIGNMIGAWGLGLASDKFGRKPITLICFLVYGIIGIASSLITNFIGFLLLRVLVGTVHHTLTHLPYVLVMEYCSKDRRTVPLFTVMMSYTLGSMLAPGLSYLVWSWKTLIIITSAPALIIIIIYKWVPESASWEITQGRLDSAARSLYAVSEVNKSGLTLEDLQGLVEEVANKSPQTNKFELTNKDDEKKEEEKPEETETILSVIKYPIMRIQVLTCLIVWMAGCMCYYGHSQNTSNLDSNLLRSFFLGSLVEIPAWSMPILIEKFGRKTPLLICFGLSGIAGVAYCILAGFVGRIVRLVMGLFGRLSVTSAYYVSLQYVPEIFPTVVRGQGVAMSETMGGLAIFLSPMIVYLNLVYQGLPLLVFGVIGFIAASVTLLLPETKGAVLPDTLKEAEATAKSKGTNGKSCPCF